MIIDQLPEISTVQETDEIPVERGTTTYKSTLQKLKDLVASLLTKSDVGLGNVDNVRQYSADNPPPYPVTSVNNKNGDVSIEKSDVGLGNVDNVRQVSQTAADLSNVDLNDYRASGFYYIRTGVANAPADWCWCIVCNGIGTMQMCVIANRIYVRCYTGSPLAWTNWKSVALS